MGQYREFMPGQVWFYYNPAATKQQEEQYERGSITNRPVVIVQAACYPEWQDTVTVVPLTSSDRRTGIHIDETILRDGVKIEGGTVIPYLLYTVKTKFLYAIRGADGRRRIVSLSDEDFALVREGLAYHFGLSNVVPDYVTHWHHLDDVERRRIVKEMRLMLDDNEDALDVSHIKSANAYRYSTIRTENTSSPSRHNKGGAKLEFESIKPDQFQQIIMDETRDLYAASKDLSRIFGSEQKLLEGLTLKECVSTLQQKEYSFILEAPLSDIVEYTGVGSTTTASRLRKEILKVCEEFSLPTEVKYPEPFRFNGLMKTNRTRVRKNLRRRKFLFGLTKDEQIEITTLTIDEICHRYPQLARGIAKNLCVDIEYLYPNEVLPRFSSVKDDIASINTANTRQFDLYETLSPQEISEIAKCDKRNIDQIAKRYNIKRDTARNLRTTATVLLQRNSSIALPKISEAEINSAIRKLAERKYDQVTDRDLYVFCRCDMNLIVKIFKECHHPAVPSKDEINSIKFDIRNRIVKRPLI